MSVAFSFDPVIPEIRATFPTTIGHEYSLFSNAPFANWSDDIVATNPFTAVVTGANVGTLAVGAHYGIGVIEWDTHEVLAVAIFQQGTSDEFTFPITWTYDGSGHVTATFTAPPGFAGENWILQAVDYSFSNLGNTFVFTTGAAQTGSLTFTPPAVGSQIMFLLWRSHEQDWGIVKAVVGSTTVDKGSYTWGAVASGFTISATPTDASFSTPGVATFEIDVGEVDSPEVVNLSVDDSLLPFGVTATLDIATGTTPYSATLTVTAASGTACGASGSVTVIGDDGSTTHSVTIPITTGAGRDDTYDETGPTGQAQIGSNMSQTTHNIAEGAMCVYNNELYWAWTEDLDGSTPYLAKWNGSSWSVIADSSIWGGAITDGGNTGAKVKLATDGRYLYFAFEREHIVIIPDCHFGGTISISPWQAECWRFDGVSWVHLGDVGSGQIINDGGGEFTSTRLELSASPDEVGACYIAYFEEGFEGPNEAQYWFSRHLSIAGFGTSTLGLIVLDGELYQFDRPTSGGHCITPAGAGATGFDMRLIGSGHNLALYSQQLGYHEFLAPYWSQITVWTPLSRTDIDLATDFPHTDFPGTFIGYGAPLIVSEVDLNSKRWVGVAVLTSFSSHFKVLRETVKEAPTTFSYTFGITDRSADDIGFRADRIIAELGQLWSVDQEEDGGISTGTVELLTDRCGTIQWDNTSGISFSGGIPFGSNPVIFEDAIWMSGSASHGGVKAYRLPICRNCGTCCGLVEGCPPSVLWFFVDGEWRQKNVDTGYDLWFYRNGEWQRDCDTLKSFTQEEWVA